MKFQRTLDELFAGLRYARRSSFLSAAAALAMTGGATAQTVPQIGMKLGLNGNGGYQSITNAGALQPTDLAGAPGYAQTNWNNGGSYGAGASVIDSSGAATSVTFSWDSAGLWSEQGGGTPTAEAAPDDKLMNGYCDSNASATNFLDYTQPVDGYAGTNVNCKPWVYIQGLNAWMTANHVNQYDVVIYTDGDNNGGRGGEYWVQSATGPWTAPGMTLGADITTHSFLCVDSTFVGGDETYHIVPATVLTGRDSQAGNWQGNVLAFTSLTNDSILIRKNVYNFRAPINAVQIVPRATPLPATIDPLLAATVYSGATAAFHAKVAGIVPMSFQWLKNGAPITDGANISGSATATLKVSPATVADQASYSLVVSNVMGAITSSVAPLAVSSPTPGSYAEKIFTNNAIAYWKLADLGDPSTNYTVATDLVGGFNGTYLSAALNGYDGVVGPQPPAFPGFQSGNGALQTSSTIPHSWVIAPPLNLSNNTVTFTAWIYPTAYNEPGSAGIIWSRNGGDVNGLDYQNNNNLGYTWNNQAATYNFASGLIIPSNMWSFVAATITPSNATLYLFNANGIATAVNNVTNGIAAFSGPTTIGDDPASAGAPDGRAFNGSIAQAAVFNYDVPALEIYNMYKKALGLNVIPVTITEQPLSLELYAGRTAVFNVAASGDTPITYQWQTNGVNLVNGGRISGATSHTLTIANVGPADATTYEVIVNNVAAQPITSVPVTLTVVASNAAPVAYEASVEAPNPIGYWRFNEAPGSLYAYDYWGGDIATNANVTTGIAGPQPPDFPGFDTTNSAYAYDGLSAYTDTQEGILNNLRQFTIVGWFNAPGAEPANSGLFGQPGSISVGFLPNLTVTTASGGSVAIPQSAITPGQWYMVAAVGDGQTLSLYLATTGAVLEASTTFATTNYGSSPYSLRIGGGGVFNPSGDYFAGQIDEVAVYNQALTTAQVSSLIGAATTGGSLAPVFASQPQSLNLFAGRTARFTANALATPPVTYQWQFNGANLSDGGNIAGSSTENLVITSITPADVGGYSLVVANPSGMITSIVATLNVVIPTPGSYATAVIPLNPVAYYELDETNDPSTGTAVANDYWGGNQGTYGIASHNGFTGVVGPRPPAFAGFDPNNYAVSMASGTPTSCVTNNFGLLDTNTATFTMWIYPTVAQVDAYTGLEMNRGGSNPAGFGYTGGHLGYTWNNNAGTTWGATWSANLVPPSNQWSFVALVVTPTNANVYMTDPANPANLLSATTAVPNVVEAHGGTWFTGHDTDGDTTRTFTGSIDDVAVFSYCLTPAQLQQLLRQGYAGAPVTLTVQHSGANVILGWSHGTLESASQVTGPYAPVVGANAPSYTAPAGPGNQFFRVQTH
ncbi:MAG TPA: LamG-like jellyroll fold domain-containing protein [Verrucomicrobiae bacterium]|nr:LamG-like jellyroll fold domain-containing protein [Verrucomicrobiae bacterium]